MNRQRRSAFTLFQLLVVIAILAILFGLLLPAVLKVRMAAERAQSQNNLKQIALACHNYHDAYASFPPGNDENHFSASARLLPFIEQQNVFQQIDFKKPATDEANSKAGQLVIKVFLSTRDPLGPATPEPGATNYLFSAGSKADLTKNDGVFFQDSKTRLADITDGTSNTIMAGETLRGDGGKQATDVRRQYVLLDKDALGSLSEESGVRDFKDGKHIAGDRGARWIDGRFLQGTFTATRTPNSEQPDVSCAGAGGLSALRSLDETINFAFCDGSVRNVQGKKMKAETWKALATRSGGEIVNNSDF
jgi:prepilin-type processing-associated H-X9-DG protein